MIRVWKASQLHLHCARSVLRGMGWMTGQVMGTRVLAVVTQLVLAWYIAPAEFGLVGLAMTVSAFFGFMTSGGPGDVLVHRQAEWERWAAPVFCFSLAMGTALSVALAAAAPAAALVYEEPRVAGLVRVIALSMLIESFGVVPSARMRIDLAFGLISRIEIGIVLLRSLLTIGFAWAGFGAMALLLPRPIVASVQIAIGWWVSGARIRSGPGWRLWPLLGQQVLHVVAAQLATTVSTQGDYMTLGWFENPAEVGLYYVAFNLSTQAIRLLSGSLMTVLQPVFGATQADPARQLSMYTRTLRVLLGIAAPACLLQAAVAVPLITCFYPDSYRAVGPLLAVLSVGMAVRVSGGLATGVLAGVGRFGTLNAVCILTTLLFLALVVPAGWLGGASMGVATAVSAWGLLYSLAISGAAQKVLNGPMAPILVVHARALALGFWSVGPGWLLSLWVTDGGGAAEQLLGAGLSVVLTPVCFGLGIKWLHPQLLSDLVPLWASLRRKLPF